MRTKDVDKVGPMVRLFEKYFQFWKILVGAKADLNDQRQVTSEEGLTLAKKLQISFIETSAKDDVNVSDAFTHLATLIWNLRNLKNKWVKGSNSRGMHSGFGRFVKGSWKV